MFTLFVPSDFDGTGQIAAVLKSHGDWVNIDETVALIESDKATIEIKSPVFGIFVDLTGRKSGDVVQALHAVAWVEERLVWGRWRPRMLCGSEHFLIVGATGSGKTTLIQMLMRSALAGGRLSPISDEPEGAVSRRALIYDSKQDVVSRLSHPLLGLKERIRILHPFDERGCAWDMAGDIDGPLSARQIATILVPQEKGSDNNAFFINAVRDLLTAVFLAFIRCVPNAHNWTFRDIILTMLYEPYLRYVLSLRPPAGAHPLPVLDRVRETYLTPQSPDEQGADPRTAANIRATINSALSVYEPVAAAWFHAWNRGGKGKPVQNAARYRLSLKEWITSNEILVLGNDEAARVGLDAINQAIFRRLTELTTALPESSESD